MSEYIITDKQLGLIQDFANVCVEGEKLPRIVRCKDCKHGHEVTWPTGLEIPSDYLDCTGPLVATWDDWRDEPKDNPVPPNGFCFGGERRSE